MCKSLFLAIKSIKPTVKQYQVDLSGGVPEEGTVVIGATSPCV
jgi:hypothetical protein